VGYVLLGPDPGGGYDLGHLLGHPGPHGALAHAPTAAVAARDSCRP
jgi:hypothetical protein